MTEPHVSIALTWGSLYQSGDYMQATVIGLTTKHSVKLYQSGDYMQATVRLCDCR